MRKNKSRNKNKNGISLIVLVLTIIVALMIISTVIISVTTQINNTNITIFAGDLTQIQDATESYYIINNAMPMLDGTTVIDKDGLLAISNAQSILLGELTENNDLNSQFYTLDLSKIEVTKVAYGNKELGENDIFVVAYPSMNVYYPYGINVAGITYFSITSKISNVTKIAQNQLDTSETSVVVSGGIKVTKISGWTNKMGVNIEANMDVGELLYMSVSSDPNRLIITTTGVNVFGFDLLTSIINDTETIKVPTLTFEEANYIELGTKPLADRYVDILKYKNSELIGKVRIDLSSFSLNIPTITSATTSSYPAINTVTLSLASSESGIREVRYEYLTKYTENGTIVNYNESYSDFDETYMQSKSRKVEMESNSTATIQAPKDVQSIKIALIDKSGNINLYNQEIAPRLYIGYTISSSTKSSLQLTSNMYSINGIKSITFSKSVDGINFTDEQVYTLNTTTNGVTTQQNIPYTNFTVNTAYIKIIATNFDSTITETRIIKVGLSPIILPFPILGTNIIATKKSTVNGEAAAYNNPVIPKGFKAINDGTVWPTDWNTGLVIEDINGNQFVWVPVDGINVPYAKWNGAVTSVDAALTTEDTLPTGVINELDQIVNYGGFYIARYEAGKEAVTMVVSKKYVTAWNNISYTNSKIKSEEMYVTPEVKSGLITGTQWDTTLKWFENKGFDTGANSSAWGNYNNSTTPANVIGYGILKVTGFCEYWKVNNIYDIAGNLWERTNEVYLTERVGRGGYSGSSGSGNPAGSRAGGNLTDIFTDGTFRVVLYIL